MTRSVRSAQADPRRTGAVALVGVSALSLLVAASPLGSPGAGAGERPGCTSSVSPDGHEPPCNPNSADSPWSGAQRNSYAQHSSPLAGPDGPANRVGVAHRADFAAPVILSFSPTYPDGKRVIWASTVGFTGEVLKIDPETVTILDKYIPQLEDGSPPMQPGVSGAYNLVDADNHLIVGLGTSLEVFGDAVPGRRDSAITLLRRFTVPPQALCGAKDQLVGITMTYDGRVAFATKNGVVATVPRDPALMDAAHLRSFSTNGADCASRPEASLEQVSNSISTDETGGIYVVTSDALYRFDDGPDGLSRTWRAGYAGAGQRGAGRIGGGSGSTPSLMGTAKGDDRFVVITDGEKLMNLVLMWRDRIPADWTPVRPGADRRIACEVPIDFGNASAARAINEQSVLIRGNSAVVVNNLQGYDAVLSKLPSQLSIYTQLLGGVPGNAPRGVERVDWDPATRSCRVVWTNPTVSIPNGIPTMSVASGMVYGVGARNGVWTLEGLDFETGRVRLTVRSTPLPTSNSTYAAATIGPDATVWTGTFGGVTRFRQCAAGERCERLGPVEAILGRLPAEPKQLTRHLAGLPN